MKTATWFQVTPGFLPAFQVFWRSLLQHNPRELFGDVIVQTNDWLDELPDGVEQRPFAPNRYRSWPAFERRISNCYAKLEALECCDYDQIVMFDTDMVCTGSIAEVYERPEPFVGIGSESDNGQRRHNGGLWKAKQPVIGNAGAIAEIAKFADAGKLFDKCDQSAMVCYLESNGITSTLLPQRFNLQIGFAEYKETRPIYLAERHDCRILHFTGPAKPWAHKPPVMKWRERFRPLWERAERGEKLTSKDVMEIEVERT
jgi:hypothetical protein